MKRKATKTIMERYVTCQNKSVCQKFARSCKKRMKISPKTDIRRVVSRVLSNRFHLKSRQLFPFYFSNIMLRTDLLTFSATGAVFKIAGEMRLYMPFLHEGLQLILVTFPEYEMRVKGQENRKGKGQEKNSEQSIAKKLRPKIFLVYGHAPN